LSIFCICIILPLFIFDGQLLFNYGLFYKSQMCEERLSYESKQFQRARHLPIGDSFNLNTIPIRYYTTFFQIRPAKPFKCDACILWNILDTLVYAIIPFIIILISSIIIIMKICERRRSTTHLGGMCHMNQRRIASQDNLSVLLIFINFLFLIMTGPLNICLIIQPILKYFSIKIHLNLHQYLRLLQNSYHALSFIFYCVIGNKFRKSACTIFQQTYCQLYRFIYGYPPTESCCLQPKIFMNNRLTTSTSTNENLKRLSTNLIQRQSCLTIDKNRKILNTHV
jgi:hypothetical protein